VDFGGKNPSAASGLDIRLVYIYTLIVDFYACGVAPFASRFSLCLKRLFEPDGLGKKPIPNLQ
jgi:hypothetical protein